MTKWLREMGDAAKAVTAVVVLGGLILSGLAVFAKASDVKEMRAELTQKIAMVQKAFTEYSTRQTISQIKAAMREIEDRTGTNDPLHMGSRDRDEYRALTDELEYYRGILEEIRSQKGTDNN